MSAGNPNTHKEFSLRNRLKARAFSFLQRSVKSRKKHSVNNASQTLLSLTLLSSAIDIYILFTTSNQHLLCWTRISSHFRKQQIKREVKETEREREREWYNNKRKKNWREKETELESKKSEMWTNIYQSLRHRAETIDNKILTS